MSEIVTLECKRIQPSLSLKIIVPMNLNPTLLGICPKVKCLNCWSNVCPKPIVFRINKPRETISGNKVEAIKQSIPSNITISLRKILTCFNCICMMWTKRNLHDILCYRKHLRCRLRSIQL